ncbi:MAG TPA: tetratricopeptide repeat protein [Candidatus Sericytochromatia bacterium]
MNLGIGQALGGRYQIISLLGQGGFGTTFLAEDLHLPGNHRCVVKQLKPQATDLLTLQTARRLFDTEAQVLYQLGNHNQIPQLFAFFEENQEFYLVQEFIPGNNLSKEIVAGQQLGEDQVIGLLIEILEILEFVHQQNVIHRDVNPDNLIRRSQDGKLVLIDFGAVKLSTTVVTNVNSNINVTVAIGTRGYLPSEQANGNPRLSSDIYAVGIIGIQALTGLLPNQLTFDAQTNEIVWRNQVSVSADLGNILDKMVRYDFRDRYQSATEALAAIKNFNTVVIAPPQASVQGTNPSPNIKFKKIIYSLLGSIAVTGMILAGGITINNIINFSNATELYQRGKALAELNKYEDALNAYQKAINLKPEYLEAWLAKGKMLLALKRDQDALTAYEQAIQIKQDTVEAWVGRGYALESLQKYQDAIDAFEKAIQIQINYPEAWKGRGDALIGLQRYQEAITSYDKTLQFQQDDYASWNSRGWALHNLQRYDEAISSYDQAVKYKPDYSEAWYNRGNSLVNLNKDKEAIKSYDQAVKFQPNYYQAWYSRANMLGNLGKYLEAVESYDKAVKIQPSNYKAWYNRGWALHQLQQYEKAIASYSKAIELRRSNYQTWYNRGNSLYQLQRYEDAIASYAQAVRYKPDYYEAWYSRGNALLNLKRYESAIASYDQAIRYKPNYQEAVTARNDAQKQLDAEKVNIEEKQEEFNQQQIGF